MGKHKQTYWASVLTAIIIGCSDTNLNHFTIASTPVATVHEAFVSTTIDIARLTGSTYWSSDDKSTSVTGSQPTPELDLDNTYLKSLTKQLTPLYIGIGGVQSEFTMYDFSITPSTTAQAPAVTVYTQQHWDEIAKFAIETSTQLVPTLSYTASSYASSSFTPDLVEGWLQLTAKQPSIIAGWQLGYQTNVRDRYGLDAADASQLVEDYIALSKRLQSIQPEWQLIGPNYLSIVPTPVKAAQLETIVREAGSQLDAISYQYYAEQRNRCPFSDSATRFDSYQAQDARYKQLVRNLSLFETYAPDTPVWITETAAIQCGGLAGSSDAYTASLWWLRHLGWAARTNHSVVMRDTLVGSANGLIDEATMRPRPDYFATILFKRLMGNTVLNISATQTSDNVYTFAHCAHEQPGKVSVLAINVDTTQEQTIVIDNLASATVDLWQGLAASSTGEVRINDTIAATDDTGFWELPTNTIPSSTAEQLTMKLPPASYMFARFTTSIPACQ